LAKTFVFLFVLFFEREREGGGEGQRERERENLKQEILDCFLNHFQLLYKMWLV